MEAKGKDGQALPYVLKRAEPETYHGRRYLHLRANGDRKQVERQHVQWLPKRLGSLTAAPADGPAATKEG